LGTYGGCDGFGLGPIGFVFQGKWIRTIIIIFPCQVLQGLLVGLGYKEGQQNAQSIEGSQDEEGIAQADTLRVTNRRVFCGVSGVNETESAGDGTQFARGSRNPVESGPEPGRVNLRRHNESSGIGSEIGEEESETVDDEETNVVVIYPVVVRDGKREHENRHEEKPLDLDDPSTQDVDQCDGNVVAWNCATKRNERLCSRDFEHLLQSTQGGVWREPADFWIDYWLEEILAVVTHIDDEPTTTST